MDFQIKNGVLVKYTGKDEVVTIPDGVREIGVKAFCTASFRSVTIPESVTAIGAAAFFGCTLTSITIPKNVTKIGSQAFGLCTSLASVTLPAGLTEISDSAFSSCVSLTSIAIPEGVRSIGDQAFGFCEKLVGITLPEGVTKIGNKAFVGCVKLKVARLPASVTQIGVDAFRFAPVTIHAPADSFAAQWAQEHGLRVAADTDQQEEDSCEFQDEEVTAPDGGQGIESFHLRNLPRLDLASISDADADAIRHILGSLHFPGSSHLVRWAQENGLRIDADTNQQAESSGDFRIVNGVLVKYNGKDAEVTVPEGVTKIGDFAFSGCSSLVSLILPEGLVKIGKLAFSGCESLTSIVIPEGCNDLGYAIFDGCKHLTDIHLPASLSEIKEDALQSSRYISATIHAPADSYAARWAKKRGLEPGGSGLWIENGVLRQYTGKKTQLTLPEGITKIGNMAFAFCKSLTDITLPEGVTEIGKGTFGCCKSLTDITLPASVTKIGEGAFLNTPVTIHAPADSYAAQWAEENGVKLVTEE